MSGGRACPILLLAPADAPVRLLHSGPALLEFLDDMPVTDRKVNAPFMLPVAEKYNEMGSIVVGKIESGRVKKGDSLLLMPNKVGGRCDGGLGIRR